MADKYLDKIYTAASPEAIRDQYNDWAASYDAEIAENGYATPTRCAEALARHLADLTAPVLDFGCGTGLSGLALATHGFRTIDGVDPAAAMLSEARKRGLYRALQEITPGAELTVKPGTYAGIAAIGVIGAGAAPPDVLDQIARALAPRGLLVFSFNDHALADPACTDKRDALLASGTFRQLEETYGDHLPGIDIKSSVYVFEKS